MKMEADRKIVKTYSDLIVWQKSISLATEIYKLTKAFPKEERFGLASQMRRCSISIPSNISEGYERKSSSDYVRFVQIAMGKFLRFRLNCKLR
jgi:four helix bundle protein